MQKHLSLQEKKIWLQRIRKSLEDAGLMNKTNENNNDRK